MFETGLLPVEVRKEAEEGLGVLLNAQEELVDVAERLENRKKYTYNFIKHRYVHVQIRKIIGVRVWKYLHFRTLHRYKQGLK